MQQAVLRASIMVVALTYWGCADSLPACPILLDSENANNRLKLIANSQDNSYSAILTCGQSKPVLVGKFPTCLSEVDHKMVVRPFFSYCQGNNVVTPSPLPNGGRFGAIEDFTPGPTFSPTPSVKPTEAIASAQTSRNRAFENSALRLNQEDDTIALPPAPTQTNPSAPQPQPDEIVTAAPVTAEIQTTTSAPVPTEALPAVETTTQVAYTEMSVIPTTAAAPVPIRRRSI